MADFGTITQHQHTMLELPETYGAEDLKKWRREEGLSHGEACNLLGVGIRTYARWEQGEEYIPVIAQGMIHLYLTQGKDRMVEMLGL